MMSWILEHTADILICALLAAAVFTAAAGIIRNKKNGKSSCGCGCAGCPMESSCHQKK